MFSNNTFTLISVINICLLLFLSVSHALCVHSPSTEGTSVHLKVFLPFAHRQEEYWPSEEGVRVKSDEGAGVAVTYQRGFMFNTHSKTQGGHPTPLQPLYISHKYMLTCFPFLSERLVLRSVLTPSNSV